MLGDPAADPFSPEPKTRWFKLTAHHLNDLALRQARALLDLLEAGAVFPRQSNDVGIADDRGTGCHEAKLV